MEKTKTIRIDVKEHKLLRLLAAKYETTNKELVQELIIKLHKGQIER